MIVKTVVWLYLFIFVAFFDLHAQYPMLTPFAISLGAAPSFIGFIMGIYSLTHLPGNWIAGIRVDQHGSKPYIVGSLCVAGILMIIQGYVNNPWQLLAVRSVSGFVLAFLSPACLALLARMARDQIHQSKLMSGNGIVHTLASVVSPTVGALLVSKIGFTASFVTLGWGLIITACIAMFALHEPIKVKNNSSGREMYPMHAHAIKNGAKVIPWSVYGIPIALSCSQGILFFEIPLLVSSQSSVIQSGILFSIVSLGALITLGMIFLNHSSAYLRTVLGSLALALIFFAMSIESPLPLFVALLCIGMSKGVIFPALAALLASVTDAGRYGRVFSLLSISFSIGAFFGPIIAGQLRHVISPFFIAFIVLMIALTMLPPFQRGLGRSPLQPKSITQQ
jgi:MFS family permease